MLVGGEVKKEYPEVFELLAAENTKNPTSPLTAPPT